MPSSGLTQLDAVNSMLGMIGETPIASLEGDLIPDAALARNILKEAMGEYLEIGWQFNTDECFSLVPDVDGNIFIPTDALRIDSDDWDIAVRGSQLYNKETNSYTWTGPVDCTIVRDMAFEDIPAAVRRYVTAMATTKFATRVLGSSEIVNQARAEEMKAKAVAMGEEFEMADYSFLDNWSVARGVNRGPNY